MSVLALILVATAAVLSLGVLGKSESRCVYAVTVGTQDPKMVEIPCVDSVRDISPSLVKRRP